jgi:hypothetical protein
MIMQGESALVNGACAADAATTMKQTAKEDAAKVGEGVTDDEPVSLIDPVVKGTKCVAVAQFKMKNCSDEMKLAARMRILEAIVDEPAEVRRLALSSGASPSQQAQEGAGSPGSSSFAFSVKGGSGKVVTAVLGSLLAWIAAIAL